MIPQATLQPSAAISKLRTSAWLADTTLNEQVNVSTMITPHKTSSMRSMGLRNCLRVVFRSPGRISLLGLAGVSGTEYSVQLTATRGPACFRTTKARLVLDSLLRPMRLSPAEQTLWYLN